MMIFQDRYSGIQAFEIQPKSYTWWHYPHKNQWMAVLTITMMIVTIKIMILIVCIYHAKLIQRMAVQGVTQKTLAKVVI